MKKENTPIVVSAQYGISPMSVMIADRGTAEKKALKHLGHVPHVFLSPGIHAVKVHAVLRNARIAFDQRSLFALPEPPDWEEPTITNYPHQFRYTVVIRAPYFDYSIGSWEEGFLCRAFSYQGRKPLLRKAAE